MLSELPFYLTYPPSSFLKPSLTLNFVINNYTGLYAIPVSVLIGGLGLSAVFHIGDLDNVANSIGVVPAETLNDADVFLVEPKYPKSVFGGRVIREGIPICDILQCYLDLYNLPDRGREQADFVFENILSKIFEKGRA